MKRKLFRLIAGLGFVLAIWGTLPVQGKGGQTPTPQYASGAQHLELAKLLDGPQLIYFPGRPYATKLFEGGGPVPICFPGDQKCK